MEWSGRASVPPAIEAGKGRTRSSDSQTIGPVTITFADSNVLSVDGVKTEGIYRDFVRDLHARLAGGRYTEIRFTAGVPRWRYQGIPKRSASSLLSRFDR